MHQILFWLAVGYSVVYMLYAILCCFSHRKWNKSDTFKLALLFICIIYVSFYAIPSRTDDLYRWYANVNWYRLGEPKKYNFSHKVMPVQTNAIFLFNWSMKLVSKMSSNGYLQVIWLTINYGALFYIVSDFTKSYSVKENSIYSYIILYFGIMPYFFSLTGLRSTAISSLFALGVYLTLFKGKKYAIYIITILAMFIHQSAIMALMVWMIYRLGRRKKFYRLIVFWIVAVNLIIKVTMLIPLDIFQLIGIKTYYYFYEYESSVDIRYITILCLIILLIYCGILYLNKRINITDNSELQEYIKFFECLILFCIGSFPNQVIFNRSIYLVSYCMVPYNYLIYRKHKKQNIVSMLEIFFAIGLNAYFLVTLNTYVHFYV